MKIRNRFEAEAEAADSRGGMTLDELSGFTTRLKDAGVPGDAVPQVSLTWRGSVKKISVK